MKLTTMLLTLTLLSGVALPPAHPGGASNTAVQQPGERQVPFRKVVNGRADPAAIRDTVAYDVFFRSLVFPSREGAEAESRLTALAGGLKITAEEADEIRAVAEEFNQNVVAFDEIAAGIKGKHLPNLSSDDAHELAGLQKRKEALITSTVTTLPARLGRRVADALRLHIAGYLKPRVRSLQPPASNHRHDSAGARPRPVRFTKAGYSPAQTTYNIGMGGYGHLYLAAGRTPRLSTGKA